MLPVIAWLPILLGSAVVVDVPEPQTRVLIIYAHDPNSPGAAGFGRELQRVIRSAAGVRVEFSSELLNFDRFPDRGRWPSLSDQIAEEYRESPPQAIVTEGSAALLFATQHLIRRFPNVPIIFGIPFEPIVNLSEMPANVTGRMLPLPFAATATLALRLQPEAERIILIGGASTLDSTMLVAAVRDVKSVAGDVEVVPVQNWTYTSLLTTLRRLPPRTIVLLSSFRRDQRGFSFNSGDLIASMAAISAAPIYGIAQNWIGDGVVGGAVMPFEEEGGRTGRLLLRVLNRAPGAPLPPVEVAPTPVQVDWRQLQRWGIPARLLPAGTQVLFRRPTTWERYWPLVVSATVVIIAQLALISLLLLERRRRRLAQRALEDQAACEQMIASVTIDAMSYVLDKSPGALVNALKHVGRFADAFAVLMQINHAQPYLSTPRLTWSRTGRMNRDGWGACHAVPLLDGDTRLGQLEIFRHAVQPWPAQMEAHLKRAADTIAAALSRARAELALEETKGQVTHIARVASLGQITAAVSHELKQPLTAIRAFAQAGVRLLARPAPDVAEVSDILRDIVLEDDRAANLIDHIRALLRNERPVPTLIDLNQLCGQVVQLLDGEVRARRVRLEVSLDPDLSMTRGDGVQLQQIVINLMLNALDAAATAPNERIVIAGTRERSDMVELFVRDRGVGLAPEVLDHVFDPFFSTKAHGLGMGLALVRLIAERHLGMAQAANATDGGAVFTVLLPKA